MQLLLLLTILLLDCWRFIVVAILFIYFLNSYLNDSFFSRLTSIRVREHWRQRDVTLLPPLPTPLHGQNHSHSPTICSFVFNNNNNIISSNKIVKPLYFLCKNYTFLTNRHTLHNRTVNKHVHITHTVLFVWSIVCLIVEAVEYSAWIYWYVHTYMYK